MGKEVKTNAMRFLEKNKISYQMHLYDSDEFTDGVATAKKLNEDVRLVYKTLVTRGKSKNCYVFVIPVARELDLKKAAKAVSEKSVEMIAVKELTPLTGYVRGGCSPIGMKKNFKTVIDQSAMELGRFFISGGRIGTQIEVSPKELCEVIRADVADILEAE